ncbi:unnamed protein product [Closterium sp. NIES-53]
MPRLVNPSWMTTELAAGRSIARPLRKVGHTSSQSRVTPPPTAGPSTVDVNTDYDTNEDDADKDTDDDDEDAESEGVDPVAQWCGDAEYNGPAEEPALAPTVGRKRGGAKTRKMASAKGKAHAEESAHSEATVEASPGKGPGSEWSPKESTILLQRRTLWMVAVRKTSPSILACMSRICLSRKHRQALRSSRCPACAAPRALPCPSRCLLAALRATRTLPCSCSALPYALPARCPALQPGRCPALQPARHPALWLTSRPALQPARRPALQPMSRPVLQPTRHPALQPARRPSARSVVRPSHCPSRLAHPVASPARRPALRPERRPALQPARCPALQPTRCPALQSARCLARLPARPAAHVLTCSRSPAARALPCPAARRPGGGGCGAGGTGHQRQSRHQETLTPQQLREWAIQRGHPGAGGTGQQRQQRQQETLSPQQLCKWVSQRRVPGSADATSLGAYEPGSTGTAYVEALHTFMLNSGAPCCFFRDCTTVTPLTAPVAVSLADPLARASTIFPCLAAPSGSLAGLHLPSFSKNLVVYHVAFSLLYIVPCSIVKPSFLDFSIA